jgi:hypothetical protein
MLRPSEQTVVTASPGFAYLNPISVVHHVPDACCSAQLGHFDDAVCASGSETTRRGQDANHLVRSNPLDVLPYRLKVCSQLVTYQQILHNDHLLAT